MEKYGGLCRSLISNVLEDRRDAEECLNSVFMRMWTSIPPAAPKDLKAYIAKAARNEALMKLRSNKAARIGSEAPLEEMALFLPAGDEAEGRELADCIGEFLKDQPKANRTAFIRRYWFFDPVKDIAARYGMSEKKVSQLLFRTRNALRKHLEKEGYFHDR